MTRLRISRNGFDWLLGPALAIVLLGLAGCFESDEERAVEAYDAHDFAVAASLAEGLTKDGNASGYQLLALMAAQGLGRDMNFADALDLADEAAALDTTFTSTRDDVTAVIEATAAAAQKAFDAADYDRSLVLAGPLADFGHQGGATLHNQLITGHYVALPGSDLSWRGFWETCSGNIRHETDARSEQAFAEQCRGRSVIWDGTVVRVINDKVYIKMRPGRPGSRQDLTLSLAAALAETANQELAVPGRKIRFAGVIDSRGTPNRADTLAEAALIGDAPLTETEVATGDLPAARTALAACRKMAEIRYRSEQLTEWNEETKRHVRNGGRAGERAFNFTVKLSSQTDAFVRAPNGDWRAVLEGAAIMQMIVERTSRITDFTVNCTIDEAYRHGDSLGEHGTLEFVTISEPRVNTRRN
jgi:hypothetical protein